MQFGGIKPVATGNSNLDTGLGIFNDVDWECLDESLINLDWSNLPDVGFDGVP